MMTICKVRDCGYWKDDFCTNRVVAINEGGVCSHLVRYNKSNGQMIRRADAFLPVPAEFKEEVKVEDA